MRLDDCFKKRLLRKEKSDMEKVKISIKIAETRLIDAKRAMGSSLFDATIVLAYASLFHSGRAILFRDGIAEKSHACLVAYLREKYADKGKIDPKYISMVNAVRFERHDVLYGLEVKINEENAKNALKNAEIFLNFVRDFLSI